MGMSFGAQARLIKAALEDALLQWKAGYPGAPLTERAPFETACNGCSMCCLDSCSPGLRWLSTVDPRRLQIKQMNYLYTRACKVGRSACVWAGELCSKMEHRVQRALPLLARALMGATLTLELQGAHTSRNGFSLHASCLAAQPAAKQTQKSDRKESVRMSVSGDTLHPRLPLLTVVHEDSQGRRPAYMTCQEQEMSAV